MYLTYAEYQNMGGTLEEATFNDLAYEAQTYIDWVTFRRLQEEGSEIPDAVKLNIPHASTIEAITLFVFSNILIPP